MDQEVEEVSFLPGEMVLNKKAVYEPTKGQRFRQIVCSRGWAICILLAMGAVMLAVSLIAAFARPGSIFTESACPASDGQSTPDSSQKPDFSGKEEPQTYIATNGKPFPWKDVRLPKTIIPEAYQLFLHANLTKSFFTGRVHMNMRVVQDTDFVVFHTEELNLTDVKLMQESGDEVGNSLTFDKELEVTSQLEYPRNQMYYLRVATLLRAGIRLQLRADFRGSLEGVSRMDGLYKSSYTVNGEERYMISTQFEASHARKAFPCMDEPNLKANFSMSIVRENRHISLFNTKLIRSSPYQDDLVLDEYEESVKMSTYLVAFVVCDFKNISKITPSGVTVRIFAPEDRIYMGQYALDVATTVLEYYAKFFGVPYPLSKQDLIAIPNFANGAMENWGLITFRDRAILYDPAVSSVSSKEWVAIVIAHELAHQWFGNLVTMKWWNDLWLNEGFASFVENIGTDVVDKDFHVMDGFVSRDFTSALTLDGLVSSHPIDVTIHSADEVEAAFDDISYKKGASLIRMLQGFVGEENFKRALTAYLQRHAYGNAETSDLWDAFQDMSNLPSDLTVSKVMATWTEQMNYPVVTVSRKLGRLHLRQDRFLMLDGSSQSEKNKKDTESPYGYKWYIPFTFTTSADPGKKTQVWMKMGSAELELSDKSLTWLKGNVGTLGFYRVNYDEEGWQAIIRQLYRDHTVFSVADRIGIIDDAFTLARAGLVDYTVPLDITKYLVNETSYFVWSRAVDFLEFLKGRLVMEEEYDLINSYTLSLAKPLIDKQGWDKKTKYTEAKMQALMIHQGYGLEYQPVLDKALQLFGQWKKDENTEVSSDLRSTVYRTGVKYGNKADWDLVYERYNHSVIPSESSNLLYSLASICDARILGILLEYSLDDSKIKSQDTSDVISSVSANMNGGLLAWRFLHRRWDDLQETLGTFSYFGRMIKNMLAQFNTQYDYDEAVEFFNTKELGTATRSVKQGLEYVESHIRWSEDNLAVVKLWFKKMANIP